MARGLIANQRPAVTGRVRSIRTLSANFILEGTAKWLATGFEPQGRVTPRRSIRLPSAKTASEMLLAAYHVANVEERVRSPSDAPGVVRQACESELSTLFSRRRRGAWPGGVRQRETTHFLRLKCYLDACQISNLDVRVRVPLGAPLDTAHTVAYIPSCHVLAPPEYVPVRSPAPR